MKSKDKNTDISHAGHRDRLASTINTHGYQSLTQIQQVEWALTLVFPRGDVNPLAHRLLNRYQNFSNILDASLEDLCEVNGLNKKSAIKLKSLKEIMFSYNLSKITNKISLNNREEFLQYLENLLRFEATESLILFALNSRNQITQYRCINMNDVRTIGIPPEKIINFANSSKLVRLICAHNHPDGSAYPSQNDLEAGDYIDRILQTIGLSLFDNFVVGDDGIYSQKQEGFVKYYDNSTISIQ